MFKELLLLVNIETALRILILCIFGAIIIIYGFILLLYGLSSGNSNTNENQPKIYNQQSPYPANEKPNIN
jgi:hypothetical protein